MSMLDEEIRRLEIRLQDLKVRLIPDFESKTSVLFSRIQGLSKDSRRTAERGKLEREYSILSKELRIRSDEMTRIRQEIERLGIQKKFSR